MAAGSMAGSDAMNEIFGRRVGPATNGDEEPAVQADGSLSLVPVTTSSVSVNDYFARRRAQLGLASINAHSPSGFTLEDQARFAEDQTASAYSGRRGLGLGRADDDEDAGRRNAWSMAQIGSTHSTAHVPIANANGKRKHAEPVRPTTEVPSG